MMQRMKMLISTLLIFSFCFTVPCQSAKAFENANEKLSIYYDGTKIATNYSDKEYYYKENKTEAKTVFEIYNFNNELIETFEIVDISTYRGDYISRTFTNTKYKSCAGINVAGITAIVELQIYANGSAKSIEGVSEKRVAPADGAHLAQLTDSYVTVSSPKGSYPTDVVDCNYNGTVQGEIELSIGVTVEALKLAGFSVSAETSTTVYLTHTLYGNFSISMY